MRFLKLSLLVFAYLLSTQFCSALGKEEKQVFEELKSKALSGDTESQYKMGKWYLVNHEPNVVVKLDLKSAEAWFRKAADNYHKESFGELSTIYYEKYAYSKERNPDNLAEAHKWRILCSDLKDGEKPTGDFFGVSPMSEKTRFEGETRAKKFRTEHPQKPIKTDNK